VRGRGGVGVGAVADACMVVEVCGFGGSGLGLLTVVWGVAGVCRVVVCCSAEREQQDCETAQRECTRLYTHFDRCLVVVEPG
jgi:hypothetical protein